jgi:hypothetical protein
MAWVALAVVLVASMLAGSGGAGAQPTGPTFATAFVEKDLTNPLAVRRLTMADRSTVSLIFVQPEILARPELDVIVVLTPLPASDSARTVVEKRGAAFTAQAEMSRDGQWQATREATATQFGPAFLNVELPSFAGRGRDDAIYVTVVDPTDRTSIWRSNPYLLRDLNPSAPGSAGVAPWGWLDVPSGGEQLRVTTESGPSLEARGGDLVLVASPPPDRLSAGPVTGTVDRVYVRPKGVADLVAPFELRLDPRAHQMAAFATGSDQPLPQPEGLPAAGGTENQDRWGTGDHWRLSAEGGTSDYVLRRDVLEAVLGQKLGPEAILSLGRTIELDGARKVAVDGTGATFPSASAAAADPSSAGLEQFGIGTTTVPPASSGSDSGKVVGTVVLVVGSLVLLGAVGFWAARAITASPRWQHRRRRRRGVRARS